MKDSEQSTKDKNSTPPHGMVDEFARETLSESLTSVRKALKSAARNWEETPEHVHQLRVRGRRALAALDLFSDLIPGSQSKDLRKQLKAILKAAGKARDLDVLLQDQLPRCGAAANKLERIWRAQRRKCQTRIVELHSKTSHKHRLRKRIRAILKVVSTSEGSGHHNHIRCDVWAASRLQDLSSDFLEAVPKVSEIHALHRFRILAKRMRYSIDILQPAIPRKHTRELRSILKDLQTQLGALQDHVVAEEALTRSLEYFSDSVNQKVLQDLIREEHVRIADMVRHFSAWADSRLGRHFAECLNEPSGELHSG